MAVTIRAMSVADSRELCRMYTIMFPGEPDKNITAEVDRILGEDGCGAFVAEEDSTSLGFAEYALRPYVNGCYGRPVPFLEGLWVDPAHRRRGIARKLVYVLTTHMRARGFFELGSDVLIDNDPSLAFHKALGFEETERVVFFRKPI